MATRDRTLPFLVLAIAVLLATHDADHLLNQERLGEVGTGFWAFTSIQYAGLAAVLLLAVRGGRAALGAVTALAVVVLAGFVVAHAAPFGLQPYGDVEAPLASWATVLAPMLAAAAALVVLFRRGAEGS